MKQLLGLLFGLVFAATAPALNIDSLMNVWNDSSQHDTIRLTAMYHVIWNEYLFNNPDTAYTLSKEALEYSKKKGYQKQTANFLNIEASYYYLNSNYTKAILTYKESYKTKNSIADLTGMGNTLNNIGICFQQLIKRNIINWCIN